MGRADNPTQRTPAADEGLQADVTRLAEMLKGFGRRRSLRDPLFSACETFDLTPPQVHSIAWLGGEGPLTMGELSRRVGITEKTITGVVDRLEARELVARERDASDRRVVHVKLTKPGAELYDRLDEGVKAALGRLLGFLDATERAQLFGILTKIQSCMEEAPPAGGAGDDS